MKRIVIATLFGVVAGALCATFTYHVAIMKITALSLGWIFLNRTVMGLVIGVSALKWHWAWNGIVMGLIVGSIFSYSLFMNTGDVRLLYLTPIGNATFGLMIEFFTSFVFKQSAHAELRPIKLAAAA
jgi:hypothetical protein